LEEIAVDRVFRGLGVMGPRGGGSQGPDRRDRSIFRQSQ
jgi:hypothetical protein